jgi:polyisoprenoid-binding protein YceI
MKKFLAIIIASSFACLAANAADTYKLDPYHNSVTWSASHFGFSHPTGKFTDIDGTLILDEQTPQKSSIEVTIKTASLVTGLSKFDEHVKSADFLNVAQFPTAKFVSATVAPYGIKSAKVSGKLTLLGITKPVTLDVKLNKIGVGLLTQRKTVGFSATAIIKRSDFGMNFGLPGISDEVKLSIESEANIVATDENAKNAITPQWKILTDKSKINFQATQDTSVVNGSFKKFDGKIIFDPSDLQRSKVAIEIDTTSVDISFADALETLKSELWLSVKLFPKAVFTSDNFIALQGKNQFRSQGKLTLKGKTVPVLLDFGLTEYSKTTAHMTGTATIKRSDFEVGNRDPQKANGVKDEVVIMIDVYAERVM